MSMRYIGVDRLAFTSHGYINFCLDGAHVFIERLRHGQIHAHGESARDASYGCNRARRQRHQLTRPRSATKASDFFLAPWCGQGGKIGEIGSSATQGSRRSRMRTHTDHMVNPLAPQVIPDEADDATYQGRIGGSGEAPADRLSGLEKLCQTADYCFMAFDSFGFRLKVGRYPRRPLRLGATSPEDRFFKVGELRSRRHSNWNTSRPKTGEFAF
jgi:hypothetical protein